MCNNFLQKKTAGNCGLSLSINLKVYSFVGYAAFSVFPLTCAAEKHLVSEKPQNIAVFQGHWGGIGGDRAQSENL